MSVAGHILHEKREGIENWDEHYACESRCRGPLSAGIKVRQIGRGHCAASYMGGEREPWRVFSSDG